MHITFLCNEYPPGQHGGLGSVMQTLGRALAHTRGHRVTIVGAYRLPHRVDEEDEGVHVVRLPHASTVRPGFIVNSWRLSQELHAINARHPIDILEGPELSFALLPRSLPGIKVLRMHGGHHFFSVTLGTKPRPWRSWQERGYLRRRGSAVRSQPFRGRHHA